MKELVGTISDQRKTLDALTPNQIPVYDDDATNAELVDYKERIKQLNVERLLAGVAKETKNNNFRRVIALGAEGIAIRSLKSKDIDMRKLSYDKIIDEFGESEQKYRNIILTEEGRKLKKLNESLTKAIHNAGRLGATCNWDEIRDLSLRAKSFIEKKRLPFVHSWRPNQDSLEQMES